MRTTACEGHRVNAVATSEAMRGILRLDEPMSGHTVWACGGPADRFYQPADLDDLACYLRAGAPNRVPFWLGLGSNLLVRDGGIRGDVIALSGALDGIEIDATTVSVKAGTACAKVARACAKAGLSGATFLAGIPGTMGGALAMNAGAFGGETWRIVARVQSINLHGELRWRESAEFAVGYRTVEHSAQEWFVACELDLSSEVGQAGEDSRNQIKQLLAKRAATQPIGLRSCGSVFRNPPNDHAGRLIESAGLKGFRIGGAMVSEKHANFIINDDKASAQNIETLIGLVQNKVQQLFDVSLVCEVHIVGESA